MPLITDRDKCAHLLRRFGLGASEAEIDYYLRDGLNGAIDRLLGYADIDEGYPVEWTAVANERGQLPPAAGAAWWTMRMIVTQRPLQEKLTLFWHDHFATSANKVNSGPLMLQQNETLRRNATGPFRTLLKEVSQDPAMILWLDNQLNVRGRANENFAREVMELFTLGVDQVYTERDIQEAARAFTGWSIQRKAASKGVRGTADFVFRARQHDAGAKTVLGKTGTLNGEDVLDILCDHPRCAELLVTKLWEWFAYPNPEPALVRRLATSFQAADLNIGSLLRDIMRSSEFYSAKAERAIVKNPVDFCVSTLRQLGVAQRTMEELRSVSGSPPRAAFAPGAVANNAMKGMGMAVLFPPDVAGWESGQSWISSATMVERIGWADRLFGAPGRGKPSLRLPVSQLFPSVTTPESLVDRLLAVFDAPLKAERKTLLLEAARKAYVDDTPRSETAAAVAVSRLIFASPEFQMA